MRSFASGGESRDQQIVGSRRAVDDPGRRRGSRGDAARNSAAGGGSPAPTASASSISSTAHSARNSRREMLDERSGARRQTAPRTTSPPIPGRRCAWVRERLHHPGNSSTDVPSTCSDPRVRAARGRREPGGPPRTRRRRPPPSARETSTPTMSPPTAPIRAATSPSAPGRSGSQTCTRTWVSSDLATSEGYASFGDRCVARTWNADPLTVAVVSSADGGESPI